MYQIRLYFFYFYKLEFRFHYYSLIEQLQVILFKCALWYSIIDNVIKDPGVLLRICQAQAGSSNYLASNIIAATVTHRHREIRRRAFKTSPAGYNQLLYFLQTNFEL